MAPLTPDPRGSYLGKRGDKCPQVVQRTAPHWNRVPSAKREHKTFSNTSPALQQQGGTAPTWNT